MLPFFQLCEVLAIFGFFLTIVSNTLLIYFTILKVKSVTGTYKQMIILYALFGNILVLIEIIARPFAHSYNRALLTFSLNNWHKRYESLIWVLVALFIGFYNAMMAFLAVQFLFRYLALLQSCHVKKFEGIGVLGWLLYPVISGASFSTVIVFLAAPDQYTDGYMRDELSAKYGMNINKTARFIMLPYKDDNSLRWNNLLCILIDSVLLSSQYVIIVYCGIQMYLAMSEKMKLLSYTNQVLQKQLFVALILQTLVATVLHVLPAFPLLLLPLFDLEISIPSGTIVTLFSFYPAIESIAFMWVVKEYRTTVKGFCCASKTHNQQASSAVF
ncbi:unnamed protein product [Caenorhabditis nigoni]